jgi:hypothetical protein
LEVLFILKEIFVESLYDYKHEFTKGYINIQIFLKFILMNKNVCWCFNNQMYECMVKFINSNKFLTGMFVWEGYLLKVYMIRSINLQKDILTFIFL